MAWIRRKIRQATNSHESNSEPQSPRSTDPSIVRYDVFKSHWFQVAEIITTSSAAVYVKTNETTLRSISTTVPNQDGVDAVRNLLEQMIYLLTEEQSSGLQLGPILEYALTEEILDKLYQWYEHSGDLKEQICIIQIKVYEIVISQAQHSLLHHKQLVNPMLKLLYSSSSLLSEEVDGHVVLLLNLLCVWINRDPTLLDIFFRLSDDQGPANFLIFSLLIDFIHKEGSLGQQARDALLLCMSLSAEDERVAQYIIHTNFCPVLATGLSGLYSSLPCQMDIRVDEWHFLRKQDWNHVPSLVNFMNSLEFCNSVVEAAGPTVSESLLNYIYNGFLVSVLGSALHKSSVNEVVVTTAYLNLFLQSVKAPALMQCFLRFLLCHRHDNALIINTLIQRIGSNSRLALISLSLFQTLLDLNCEDLMLHLVFQYLIPCNHILASQMRSMRDTDVYSVSALRFITLAPSNARHISSKNGLSLKEDSKGIYRPVKIPESLENVAEESNDTAGTLEKPKSEGENTKEDLHDCTLSQSAVSPSAEGIDDATYLGMLAEVPDTISEYSVNEDLSVTVNMHPGIASNTDNTPTLITSPYTMAEFGSDLESQVALNTSYMDYLEDAKSAIESCRKACNDWSEPYDGEHPSAVCVQEGNAVQWKHGSRSFGEKSLPLHGNTVDTHSSVPSIPTHIDMAITGKYRAESDPCPRTHHLDEATSVGSATQQALNATYQALDITARVLNNNNVVSSNVDEKCHQNDDGKSDERCVEEEPKSVSEPKTSVLMNRLEGDLDTGKDIPENEIADLKEINPTTLGISGEEAKTPTFPGRSVDEFFRSLMESVPLKVREQDDKMVTTRMNDENEALHVFGDDIESGIEVSSDGADALVSDEYQHENRTPDLLDDDLRSNVSDNLGDEEYGNSDSHLDMSMNEYAEEDIDDTTSFTSSSYDFDMDYMLSEDISIASVMRPKMNAEPYTGPFLGTLFVKMDQMLSNSLYENLLVTGIISRLACYPQPLLRSFLLNTNMVLHPSARSLYSVLSGIRNRIDAYSLGIENFVVLVCRAQKYLISRVADSSEMNSSDNLIQNTPMPVPRVKTRNTRISEVFLRRKNKRHTRQKLEALLEQVGKKTSAGKKAPWELKQKENLSKVPTGSNTMTTKRLNDVGELRTRNVVYAAVILNEFLKELAAISQEHAVTCE